MKYLSTSQNFQKSKLPHFQEFDYPKKGIYVNKVTLQIFDIFIKLNYLIGPNILQLAFDFITYSYYLLIAYYVL